MRKKERERERPASINIPGARYRYGSRSRTRRTRSTPSGVECNRRRGASLSYRREMFLSRLYIESTSIVARIKLSFRRGLREEREGSISQERRPLSTLCQADFRFRLQTRIEDKRNVSPRTHLDTLARCIFQDLSFPFRFLNSTICFPLHGGRNKQYKITPMLYPSLFPLPFSFDSYFINSHGGE